MTTPDPNTPPEQNPQPSVPPVPQIPPVSPGPQYPPGAYGPPPTPPPAKSGFPRGLLIGLLVGIPVLLIGCVAVAITAFYLIGRNASTTVTSATMPPAIRSTTTVSGSAGTSRGTATPEVGGSGNSSGVGGGNVLVSTDGRSQITLPASWSKQQDLNDSAELQAGSRIADQYLIVLTENQNDLSVKDVAEYADLLRESLAQTLTDATFSAPRELTINGMPAVQYEITATVDSTKAAYWLTAIQGKEHYYQVLGWTLNSRKAQNGPIIQSAIESFQETEK